MTRCYTDTHNAIVYVKSEEVYVDPVGNVEKSFDTSNYAAERALNGRIMKEFVTLRLKMCSYLTVNGCIDKKANGTNKCVKKRKNMQNMSAQ